LQFAIERVDFGRRKTMLIGRIVKKYSKFGL
jgi:hypothetical protein